MTTLTPSGAIGADNLIDNIDDLNTWAIFGAQAATSFGIELALENRIVFHGTGFGAYSGNMPTTGSITSLTITNLDSGVVERETWSGFSFLVSDFLTWISANNNTALQDAIFGGADTLNDTAFGDTLFGYGGNDTFSANAGGTGAGDIFDGGAGTDTLLSRGADVSFHLATLASFERLQFGIALGTETSLIASFAGSQIGAGLSSTLAVVGFATVQDIVIINVSSGSVDISGWTFSSWNPNQAIEGDSINLVGSAGANTLTGSTQRDIFNAGDGADTVFGGDGDDQIYGAADAAADHMFGGDGEDVYFVYEAGDIIHENLGEGFSDYAAVSINYTMVANLENMALNGTALTATGNGLNNGISGNELNNVLRGMAGEDSLSGNAGADTLFGGAGADSLNGGANIDTASYSTSASRVRVNLSSGAGLDADAQGDTLTGIENLIGSAFNDVLTGDAGTNKLAGGDGADTLKGGSGADKLNGGLGLDVLTGHGGADTFVFNTAPAGANRDTITDYNVAADTIQLENGVFIGLGGATGVLAASKFFIGASAHDSSDRILYDSANGRLYFDADGNGAGAKIWFATLDTGLALTAADFVVI